MRKRWLLLALLGSFAVVGFACDPFGADEVVAATPAPDAGVFVDAGTDGAPATPDGGAPDTGSAEGGVHKRVFVSAGGKDGDLVTQAKLEDTKFTGDGVAAADLLCGLEASKAGLPGTFRAWISTSQVGAASRFVDKAPRYSALDVEILTNIGSPPVVAIPDVKGAALPTPSLVWTGTGSDGMWSSGGGDCGAWASATPVVKGLVGDPNATSTAWTNSKSVACSPTTARLYCIQI